MFPDSDGYLTRAFQGGGALERPGDDRWELQELTRGWMPSKRLDDRENAVVCLLATAAGTHHVFYAAEGGDIVEL